jgi:3-oxoacyl-[acyl-carrier protein] reductase
MARKRIVVTGATGGIGKPLCHHLAKLGYDLILATRNQLVAESFARKLHDEYGADARNVAVDFASQRTIELASAAIKDAAPRIDGFVIMPPQISPTNDCLPDPAEWRRIFDLSFIGPLELFKGCLSLMGGDARTKVVVVSGISSVQVLGHYATSNVLRLAWLAEAKTLAHALGPKSIHVNTLSLGGVMTEKYREKMIEKAASAGMSFETQMEIETSNVPLRKYAAPDEVAVAIEALLSGLSDHMTGMNLQCDGGFTRAY